MNYDGCGEPSACERARERAGITGKSHLGVHAENAHQDFYLRLE